jgi:hypothetical protein
VCNCVNAIPDDLLKGGTETACFVQANRVGERDVAMWRWQAEALDIVIAVPRPTDFFHPWPSMALQFLGSIASGL